MKLDHPSWPGRGVEYALNFNLMVLEKAPPETLSFLGMPEKERDRFLDASYRLHAHREYIKGESVFIERAKSPKNNLQLHYSLDRENKPLSATTETVSLMMGLARLPAPTSLPPLPISLRKTAFFALLTGGLLYSHFPVTAITVASFSFGVGAFNKAQQMRYNRTRYDDEKNLLEFKDRMRLVTTPDPLSDMNQEQSERRALAIVLVGNEPPSPQQRWINRNMTGMLDADEKTFIRFESRAEAVRHRIKTGKTVHLARETLADIVQSCDAAMKKRRYDILSYECA